MCGTGYMMVLTRTWNRRSAMKVTRLMFQPWPKGPTTKRWGGIVHKILTLHLPRIYILYMGLLYLDWRVWLVFFFPFKSNL